MDFPVLVVLDSTRIDYTATQDSGQDLRFVDPNGTALAYEIEEWDEADRSYVWVKVPQVDGLSDSDYIWMYYGDSSAAAGQTPPAVWANGYRGVYHLNEDPSLTAGVLADASPNGFDGANQGSTDTIGFIAGAAAFDSSLSQYIDLGADRAFINGVSQAFLSAWFQPSAITANPQLISLSVNNGLIPTGASRAGVEVSLDEVDAFGRSTDTATFQNTETTNADFTAGTWYYVAAIIDYANDTILVYTNGVSRVITGPVAFINASTPNTNSTSAALGSEEDGSGGFYHGLLDEVRIVDTTRSAGWVEAQFESMTDSFITYDTQQSIVLSVAVSASTFAFGVRPLDTWLTPQSSVVTNDGTVPEHLIAQISPFSDGTNTWELSATSNGADSIRAQWSTTSDVGPWNDIAAYDSGFTIDSSLAVADSITLWLRIMNPTGTSSFNEYSSSLSVSAQEF